MKQRYVVLDLETTGNSPKKQDKIIQVGAVLIEDGEITERFASFVNPECTIPPFIEQLTNIKQKMVQKAPTFKQIAPMLIEMLEGSSLVAHNVPFDLSFLQYELKENGFPAFSGNTFDTVELARILLPTQSSYKLTDLALYYQLNHDNPHRADSDAEATAIIFIKLLEKINLLPAHTVLQLHKFLYTMKSDIYLLFQKQAYILSDDHVFYDGKIMVKKAGKLPQNTKSVKEEFQKILDTALKGGQAFTEVKSLFEARQHGLIEIPPARQSRENFLLETISFALENDKKVVVSTGVVEAQNAKRTLLKKFSRDASFLLAEIKGKYYYLSLPKFVEALEEEDDNYDAVLTKAQILVWLTETETGDMEELSLSSGGRLLWDSINCAYSSSTTAAKEETCFYSRARNKLQEAAIIMTNHSFLAKEIWKSDVFADLEYFIVENANAFQLHVSKFVGKEVSYLDFYFGLIKLQDTPLVQQAKEELDDTFRIIRSYSLHRTKNAHHRALYRYDILKEKSAGWFAVQEAAQRLHMKLTEVLLQQEKKEYANKQEIDVLRKMRDTFYSLLFESRKNALTWFDVNTRGARNSVTIYEQPMDISQSLAERFYQQKSSVVFISPALSVGKSFDYVMEELGLTDFYPRTVTKKIHQKTSEYPGVFIPTDMPLLSRGKNETFIQIAALQIRELLEEKGGRILVAFSSIEMLSSVYNELKSLPDADETVVVSQSSISGGKQKILKAASNFDQAILLVTNSFLEEVSIKHEKINSLVIIRLPFSAMDEPIMAAKLDQIEKQGRNSFTDVSLPVAVLRFKKMVHTFLEGSGPKDIFIFDRRVIDKRYGESFIEAVPNAIVKKDSFFSIINSMN
jgi:ATP-dependent DNA helicase DinG